VDQLVKEGLLAEGGDTDAGSLEPVQPPLEYAPPSLDKYDDLKDLLLLDPIHEVAETGWPTGRTD